LDQSSPPDVQEQSQNGCLGHWGLRQGSKLEDVIMGFSFSIYVGQVQKVSFTIIIKLITSIGMDEI